MSTVSIGIQVRPRRGSLVYKHVDVNRGRERVILLAVDYTVYHGDYGFADLDNVTALGINGKPLQGWKAKVVKEFVLLDLEQGSDLHVACWNKGFGA
jgi:hypothetical protein